jgi:hypothetical protein
MPPSKLTTNILSAAIEGLESQKRRIDAQIAELRAMLSGSSTQTATMPEAPPHNKRKKFSAATRRRMKEAQQRRWAKIRGASEPALPAKPEAPKPKRQISEEGMKRIIAATKTRWARQRAEAAKATTKKSAPLKGAAKKAVKAPPAKVAKKSTPMKKASVKKAAKNTAQAPAQAVTEAGSQ